LNGDWNYEITGIGAPRVIVPNAGQEFDFTLVHGSATVTPDHFLGWKDGSYDADSQGAIGYVAGGESVQFLGGVHAAAGNVEVGVGLDSLRTDSKSYAINAEVISGAILEFDLGRFLDYVGNPDAIGEANLLLDIPEAVAAQPGPINVHNLTAAGGLLYFTGYVEQYGFELWVTDGTLT
ncbi:MAG: hypothetical protein GY917_11820, partial [Planctomycetaceae bacterium]|nr:hypothetical protein [Planctomycetaceae bacterium]